MPNTIPSSNLEKFTTFGDLLRYLRRRAGITQLEFSIAVGYSDSQISRLEQNMRLPDPLLIEARFVPALLLEDEPLAVSMLLELAANVRREDAPALGMCPYKGMDYFDEADADLFVGREALTEKLLGRVLGLTSRASPARPRFFTIVGASGSGKSSLVRAGLVPALRWNNTSAHWPITVFTPSLHPLESMATGLAGDLHSLAVTARLIDDLARDSRTLYLFILQELKITAGKYLVVVVDQFEELFTLCHNEAERSAFIQNLITAASAQAGGALVIITLRADFYPHCSGYSQLRDALAAHQEYIGAMSDQEMRRVIEEPAQRGRWELEPGLVELILNDVGHEPGALPLLSHSLLETWRKRHGRALTLGGYLSAGGVRGAIAETAQAVFADQFSKSEQAIARRIFIRLTELGDETGTGDTRRRATINELILKPEDLDGTRSVLKTLADARLVTIAEDSVQVAHEALIREWPTLRGWLEENREGLRLHRQLTEAAEDWQAARQDPGLLFRGARLAQACEWATTHTDDLNAEEREFLAASQASIEREATEREATQQRALDAALKLADTERQRAEEGIKSAHRLRRRSILSISIGIVAVILAVVAFFAWQGSLATAARLQSLNLASAAMQANNTGRGDLALSLAQAAIDVNQPPIEALKAFRIIATTPGTRAILTGHAHSVRAVAFSPDAKTAFSGSCSLLNEQGLCTAGELILWDLISFKELRRWSAHTGWVTGVAYSPDGLMLISGSDDGSLISWDLNGQEIGRYVGHTGAITDLTVVDSIHGLLSSSADGTLILWGIRSREILRSYETSSIPITSISVASSIMYAASAQQDGSIRLWNLLDPKPLHSYEGQESGIHTIAISPDGARILYTSQVIPNMFLRMIDSQSGVILGQYNFTCPPGDIAIHPDFSSAFVACQKDMVQLEPRKMEAQRSFLESGASINSIAVSQDGQLGISASADGCIRIWNLGEHLDYQITNLPADRLNAIAFTDNADYLLVNDARINGEEEPALWNLALPGYVTQYLGFSGRVSPGALAASPDSSHIAAAGSSINPLLPSIMVPSVAIWDRSVMNMICSYDEFSAPVRAIAFTPYGQHLLAGSQDQSTGSGQLVLLDVRDCQLVHEFNNEQAVLSIDFNHDGSRAITGLGSGGQVILWDMKANAEIRRYTFIDYGSYLPVAFAPDDKSIIGPGPAGLIKVDVATGDFIQTYSGLSSNPTSLAISPDDRYVVASALDGTILLWDYITGEELHRLDTHLELVDILFSSDSATIYAAATEGKLVVWRINEKSLSDLLDWIYTNRYVRDLTCLERQQFKVNPQCKP
jgi:WD40 repeat protein